MKYAVLSFLATASLVLNATPVTYIQPTTPFYTHPVFSTKFEPVVKGTKTIPLRPRVTDGHLLVPNGGTQINESDLSRALGNLVFFEIKDSMEEQIRAVIKGEPFFRGTLAQVALANDGLTKINPALELIVIYQLSWSTGDDTIVSPKASVQDLKGQSMALQLYGPTMLDLMPHFLESAGLTLNDITFKYTPKSKEPTSDIDNLGQDPANAIRLDPTIAAAAVTSYDSQALTSGEGIAALKDAKLLFSSQDAKYAIADVIAVRRDYFEENQKNLREVVKLWLNSASAYKKFLASKQTDKIPHFLLLPILSKIFLGDPSEIKVYIDTLRNKVELADVSGNVEFFQNTQNLYHFEATDRKLQDHLKALNLIEAPTPLRHAQWNWADLSYTPIKPPVTKVVPSKQPNVRKNINLPTPPPPSSNLTQDQGNLLTFTVYFSASSVDVDSGQYTKAFEKLYALQTANPGATITIRGHTDTLLYNFFRMKLTKGDTTYSKGIQQGIPIPTMESLKQTNTQLSHARALAVKNAYIKYIKTLNPDTDIGDHQFDIQAMGYTQPVYPNPMSKEESSKNMRVDITISTTNAEIDENYDLTDYT